MAGQAGIVLPGTAHYVTQRGTNCQDVFFMDRDRRRYVAYLKECAALAIVVEGWNVAP